MIGSPKATAGAGRSLAKVRRAIKSNKGALRHAQGIASKITVPAVCPDNPSGGPHSYTADLEYYVTGNTINCEFCGEERQRSDLHRSVAVIGSPKATAGAGRSLAKVRRAIKSNKGALRHAQGIASKITVPAVCPDNPSGGPHSYTADLEYDVTGNTINCEFCGEERQRSDLHRSVAVIGSPKAAARKVYVSRVVVRCTSVPFVMMRYDNCVPDGEEDAYKLDRIARHSASPEDKKVTFRRYSATPGKPTMWRWPGFGGRVISWEYVT